MKSFSLGIIVNTWNKPRQLQCVLRGFSEGTVLPDEIIVADDGSDSETKEIIVEAAKKTAYPIRHAWQKNEGYRRSRILNMAVAMAKSDYLVFVDGDCVPHHKFVADHQSLAKSGYFVQARRAFVEEDAVEDFIEGKIGIPGLLLKRKLSGVFKLIRTPAPVIKTDKDLHGILGCNLGIWREDLIKVNGYDESYTGWGAEDSDLAARLFHLGRERQLVHGRALLYHLNHPVLSRDRYEDNKAILNQTIETKKIRCTKGLDQHPQ